MDGDLRSEQVKTVYAHFGLAIYLSQVLEHGLVNALFALDLIPRARVVATKETWPAAADAFFDEQFRKTLGRMIERIRSVTSVPATLEGLLTRALEKRNWLAHHYFRERAQDFLSEGGRNRMISELEEAQRLFSEADKELEAIAKPLLHKYGYTEERLKVELDEMLKKARNDL